MIPLYDDNRTRRFPVVTVALITTNAAVFVAQLLLPRWGLTTESWFLLFGARPIELTQHVDLAPSEWVPWWATLITALFVHAGWLHVVFNMWYLWIFGNNVEDAMTRPRYLVFYLACGMAATATQVLAAPASDVPIVGASGAVAGVLGAYLVLYPRARVFTVIPLVVVWPVLELPAWVLLVVWFALQGLGGVRSYGSAEAGVAFFAHIGGFVAGMALAAVFATRGRRGRPLRARRRV
ncbi:MAG: rhomboid family intramembrane serine protease [Actinobacteria bacterium]|nr:rhomboid family intramembrane serine protease [Actinomycetota bacterium]